MYKVCFSRKDVNSTLVLTIWHEQAMRSKGRSIQRRDYHRVSASRGPGIPQNGVLIGTHTCGYCRNLGQGDWR